LLSTGIARDAIAVLFRAAAAEITRSDDGQIQVDSNPLS
jgi:hypothetical protein